MILLLGLCIAIFQFFSFCWPVFPWLLARLFSQKRSRWVKPRQVKLRQVTPTPFQVISPTPSPTITATATPVPSPTVVPCTEKQGRIEPKTESFSTSSVPVVFRIYFPPCFDQAEDIRYPVLYMIHGQTFKDDQWERLGIGPAADALINEGKSPPFLIVMPLEENTYGDIYLSPFTRDVLEGIIPWVDANFPTCTERICRAIGGLSRGGAWSLRLGFMHWELFGSIGLHSTPPFNTDESQFPIWVRQIPPGQLPRVYMDIGRRDPFLSNATSIENLMVRYDVPHEWYLNNGTHEEPYWSAHAADYLEWYTQPWQEISQKLEGDQAKNP